MLSSSSLATLTPSLPCACPLNPFNPPQPLALHPSPPQILFTEAGYTYLDVRPKLEYEDAGGVKGSVNIPIVNKKYVYDPAANRKNIVREDNPNFVADVSDGGLDGG